MKLPVWAYAVAAVLAAALIAWGLWSFDPFGRRKHAQAKAAVAVQQTGVETAKTEAVERVIRSEVIIRQQQAEAIHAVQVAQGSEAPLSPDVGRAVRDGVERMRRPAEASGADGAVDASGDLR